MFLFRILKYNPRTDIQVVKNGPKHGVFARECKTIDEQKKKTIFQNLLFVLLGFSHEAQFLTIV